jgi:hypothetical protein
MHVKSLTIKLSTYHGFNLSQFLVLFSYNSSMLVMRLVMIIGISSIGVIGGIFEHCLFGVHDEFLITILPIPRVDLSHLDEQPPFRINTFPHVSTFGGRLKSFTLGKKNHVV